MESKISFERLLIFFVGFIFILICIRFIYTGKFNYIFLLWNIFLAWIPFIISPLFKRLASQPKWMQGLVFFSWMVFFPNALYVVTDLVHLETESSVPKWYDTVLLFSSSVVALMMAFISLLRVEAFLKQKFKISFVEPMVIGILFLGSFGVYLGRFLRWNSWDIIRNPFSLAIEIANQVIFPFQHFRTWGITMILTILFYLLYLAIKKMPGYLHRTTSYQ